MLPRNLDYVKCICGADDPKTVWMKRGYNIVKCSSCGLIYTNPRIPTDTLLRSEIDYNAGEENIRTYIRDYLPKRMKTFAIVLDWLEPYKQFGNNLLEIGCNGGFFLHEAQKAGWDVRGIEPSPTHANYAKEQFKIHVHSGTLETTSFNENSFDVVVLLDVLEHLENPDFVLALLHNWIRPKGIIVIRVPNADALTSNGSSPLLRIYRRFYVHYFYPINPEQHYYHFSPNSLGKLLMKNGFIINRIGYETFEEMPNPGSPLKKTLKVINKRLGALLNFPTEFMVLAERV